jgi:hypothetical protein
MGDLGLPAARGSGSGTLARIGAYIEYTGELLSQFHVENRPGVELLTWDLDAPCAPFWLGHRGFVTGFIRRRDGELLRVKWRDAVAALDVGDLAAPPVHQRVLRLAASMAAGVPVSLRDCFEPGDRLGACGLVSAIRESIREDAG